jgi:PAS domain S-box-containing protein
MLKKFLVYILFILPFLILLNSQTKSQSFHITKYSTDNGLPDNRVNDIAQDSLGRIWIAMVSGIAMYDGYEWTKYGEKEGVPEVEYARIKVDEKGVIWFMPRLLSNNPIIYQKKSKWLSIQFDSTKRSSLESLSAIEITYKQNNPTIYVGSVASGVFLFYNNKWANISTREGLISDSITGIINIKNNLIISTAKGVSIYQINKFHNLHLDNSVKNTRVLGICKSQTINNDNYILIFGSNWLGKLIEDKFEKLNIDFDFPAMGNYNIHTICQHSSGDIFLASPAALYIVRRKNKNFEKLLLETPQSDRGVNSILIDYEGNLWLSSLRGIYKLKYQPFLNLDSGNGLLENEVSAISQFYGNEDLIFGHNYGLTIKSGDNFKRIPFLTSLKNSTKISRVLHIYKDPLNNINYFVSNQKGIGKIKANGDLQWIKNNTNAELFYHLIKSFKGNLLVSTDIGLLKIKANNIVNEKYVKGRLIRGSFHLTNKYTLVAHDLGLTKIDIKGVTNYRTLPVEANNLFSINNVDQVGILLGSVKGLYIFKQDSIIKFNFNNQDITDPIYFIIQDSSKNVWLGTNNGVLRWDGKNLKRYNKSDGLAGNETNRAAGFVDSKGNVWIGTDEGVSMYTGNEPDYSLFPPKIMLLDFYDHDNFVYDINKDISLDPDKKNLTFNFRGLSFIDEKRNSYQIRLLERNGDHIDEFATNSSSIRLSNLAPGEYIFSVRVQNAKGIWSEWKSSAVITIQQHFYNKPVFYLSLLSALFFVAYITNNYFQQKKYTKRLEVAVDLRTKDLKDTQEKLVTSVNRYRGIIESQTDLVIRITEEGILTFINDAFCAVFGKSRDELIGTSFVPLVHPEDVALTFEGIKKLNIPPYRSTIEQRAFTIDGYRWFSWEGYAIHDHQGSILEIQAVGRDITLQKEVETELEKRVNERTIELQSLISQSPIAILTFDAEGFLLTYNKIASEMLLSLENYLPPEKTFNIFNEEFLCRNKYDEKLLNLDSANSFLLTTPIKIENTKNSIYTNLVNHYLVYRIYNVMFDESNKMYVLLLDDVTEQLIAEEVSKNLLEEKIRISTIIKTIESERSRFATELHDGLGQLLTTAKLKLDVIKLKTEKNIAEINETVNILINAGDEIRRIINDLKPSDVERFGLISSIELLVERTRHTSGIKILLSVLSNFQITDKNFELTIYRIVQEALNNIVKHSQCNRATIEILTEKGEFLLSIKDDGIGVDLTSKNENTKSYGIRNIKERVKSLNGKIEIESEPGKGFNYLIKIPI